MNRESRKGLEGVTEGKERKGKEKKKREGKERKR